MGANHNLIDFCICKYLSFKYGYLLQNCIIESTIMLYDIT